MKRILYLVTGLGLGGAEMLVVDLVLRISEKGWTPVVVSMIKPGELSAVLESHGIPVLSLGMKRGIPDPRALFKLKVIIRRFRPCIVHSHMVHANLLGRITRLICDIPVLICTAHNIFEGGRLRDLAYRITDRLADVTTQVCDAGMRRYLDARIVSKQRMQMIPNGIDTDRFRPRSDQRIRTRSEFAVDDQCFIWLAVGRLERAKDYPTMLKAFKFVTESDPQAQLWIAGEGSLMDELKVLVAELGLCDNVMMLGKRMDIPALMNAADAFVMSSIWEGMPLALMEASSSGLPVVATDVGGNAEVVRNGVTGYLVRPEDPNALAEAMLQIMSLPAGDRLTMGNLGRSYICEKYNIDNIVNIWDRLYTKMVTML